MGKSAVVGSKEETADESIARDRVFNPLDHPISFTYPSRIASSGWLGHVPFAFYLIDVLRPKSIVELGTHHGVSYCAFCQGVKELDLETRCYAIDSWQGDSHSGLYESDVLSELEEHHNPKYDGFSQLIQSNFDDALGYFADHTFDLLHIDGFHTYEAVKQDFEKWLPKLSDRGVVLFHDINVRELGFGVWKFWEELKPGLPHFEFVHSNGLGVLAIGERYPAKLNELFQCSAEEAIKIRSFFASLGARIELTEDLNEIKRTAHLQSDDLIRMQDQIERSEGEIVSIRAGFEAQLARDLKELAVVRSGYERQIDSQKDQLLELRAAHDEETQRQKDEFAQARLAYEPLLALWEKDFPDIRSAMSTLLEHSKQAVGVNQSLRSHVESPEPESVLSDSVEVRGWVYSIDGPVTRVEAFVDDIHLGSVAYGGERADVAAAFPDEAPRKCGYKERFMLRGLGLEGERLFKICVYDEKGNTQTDKRRVTIEAPDLLSLPAANNRSQANSKSGFKAQTISTGALPLANAELSQQMEEAIAEFQRRMECEPSILDCDSGLQLADSFPHLAVFSPLLSESFDPILPYLDHSIDIVVVSAGDPKRIAEARRVAAVAVIQSGTLPDKLQRLTPSKLARPQDPLSIEWLTDQGDASPMPMTSIIIPVFNKVSYTQSCLEQLNTTLPQDFHGEIIVVDDASSDETPNVLKRWTETDERVKVLSNPENLGFIASCNRGAESAQGEFLVFLNNDTLPLTGWLPPLLRVLRDNPEAGAVGGKLVYPDGTLQEAGGVIFSDGSGCNFGKFDKAASAPLYNFLREVDYCSGALLATRRDLFSEFGGFDERFKPAYYEDVDYCFTLREKGYRVYYQPESVIVHFEGISSGTDLKTGVKSYQVVNQNKFVAKWSQALKQHYPAPDQLNPSTLQTISRRNGSAVGGGN